MVQSTRVKPFSLNTIDAICESRFDGFSNEFCGTDGPMQTGRVGYPGIIPARFPSVRLSSRLYIRKRTPGKLSFHNCEWLRSELQSPMYALFSRVFFLTPRPNLRDTSSRARDAFRDTRSTEIKEVI